MPVSVDPGTNIYVEFEFYTSKSEFNKLQWDQKEKSEEISFDLNFEVVDYDGERKSGRFGLLGQWVQDGIPTWIRSTEGQVFDLLPPGDSSPTMVFKRNENGTVPVRIFKSSSE